MIEIVLLLSGVSLAMAQVFIVGCGHSGTTVLHYLIGSLPECECVPKCAQETYTFERMIGEETHRRLSDWDDIRDNSGAKHWVEKTPRHVHYFERILEVLPDAKFIVMHRNIIDVVASLVLRKFSFEQSLSRWLADNEASMYLLKTIPDQSLSVCYEDLQSDRLREVLLKQICAFLELDQCLSFEELDAIRVQNGNAQFPDANKPKDKSNGPHHHALRRYQMTQPFNASVGNGLQTLSQDQIIRLHLASRSLDWSHGPCLRDHRHRYD